MKRSNAPSAAKGASKRPSFLTPFKTTAGNSGAKSAPPPVSGATTESDADPAKGTDRDSTAVLQPQLNPAAAAVHRPPPSQRSAGHAPSAAPAAPDPATDGRSSRPEDVKSVARYFSVVWGKLSKKKHKTWEGDAVLVVNGRTATLLDLEGKEIGKSSSSSGGSLQKWVADGSSLADGSTMVLGGKEIEVTGIIDPAAFTSGACFNSIGSKSLRVIQSVCASTEAKPFRSPCPSATSDTSAGQQSSSCGNLRPRHDPSTYGALVLPRPDGLRGSLAAPCGSMTQLVDVVVDPHVGRHLRPHQREGVTFLYECVMGMKDFHGQGAILADEMGLGKTLQVIALIWTLLKQGPYGGKSVIKRVLIVTPGSLVKNWNREFRKWLGTERLSVYCVDSDNKAKEFANMPLCPVMIISYEMLLRCIDDVRDVQFGLLVCDEGHRLKNSNIKTTTLLSQLDVQRRIILTGTPVQNDLQEFFALADFCNPNILGSSASFRRLYEQPIVESKQPGCPRDVASLGAERAAELSRLTSTFVLRRTSELNEAYLPPRVEYTVFCRPSSEQEMRYRALAGDCMASSSAFLAAGSSQHLQWIGKLRKLCNHPGLLRLPAGSRGGFLTDDDVDDDRGCTATPELAVVGSHDYPSAPVHATNHLDASLSGKCAVLERMLAVMHSECAGDRIVLVSNYTQTLDLLGCLCDRGGYRYSRLDGRTPTGQRQQIVESFNNARSCPNTVFLLSSKAGGVGLNLTGANRLILFDIDWNPANDLQAMARIWRDGQRKRVHIYRLLTVGTIEEKMYQRQLSKLSIGGAVTGDDGCSGGCGHTAAAAAAAAATAPSLTFSIEELKDLFSYRSSEETDCDTHDLLDCDCCREPAGGGEEPQRRVAPIVGAAARRRPKPPVDLSASDLMSWQHVPSSDIGASIDDKLLQAAANLVTFVFVNRQSQAPENDGLPEVK